jgi:HEAT repeat protein
MAMTPRARIDAVEALTQTNELDKAREVLSRVAIIDQNPDVRLAALEALDEIDAVPFETLADVAWYDSDPSVRLSAVELIGEAREKGMRVVEFLRRVAKMDSSNEVRQLASNFVSAVMKGK